MNLNPNQFGRMYHVTTQDALGSIKEHGLDNTRSTKEMWSNSDDWDDGAYLWDSPHKALSYARNSIKGEGARPVVLGISPKGLDLSPDDTGDSAVHGAYHAPHVPANNITFPKRFR